VQICWNYINASGEVDGYSGWKTAHLTAKEKKIDQRFAVCRKMPNGAA
jgi:hypothetical protein